jgi:predicted dehydrogenase
MQWITGEKLITTQSDFITGVVSPYDDLALVSGRLPSGALWHSEVSWLSPTKKRGLDFLFVSGAVSLDLLTGEVVIIRQSGEEHHWDVIRELRGSISSTSTVYGIKTLEPLLSMHETLVAAISSGDWSTLPRLEDSLEVLDLIETLYSG